ncbi:MAG: alpha/beta hydrolase [Cellvibrionaceae bacterium]
MLNYYIARCCSKIKFILGLYLTLLLVSACSSFQPERLDYSKIDVSKPSSTLEYGVYTPPGWTKDESLPLVLFLHGGGDNHTSFEKFKADEYFDREINAGNIPRVILLTPNGKNGFWENWHDGTHNYRDWVLNEVMPKVQQDYNTLACPEHCHLAGISMGGFGALRFAYFANDRFSSISAMSAPILSEEENKKAKKSILIRLLFPLARIFGPDFSESYKKEKIEKVWLENKDLQKMRLQLVVGDNDREQIMKANHRFHALMAENNVDHNYIVYKGGHKWKYWIPNLDKVINFLVNEPKTKG